MDFVFMLTRDDRTISNGLAVLDEIRPLGLTHIGFKDVGLEPAALGELHRRIKELGATSYLEVVSTTPEACLQSARMARELGVDRLLGGTQIEDVMTILAGSGIEYLPFPGRPFGHPTKLRGSADDIARDCQRFRALGAAGVDLLAYRAVETDPLELVRAARRACDGTLLVAGGVAGAEQVRALADAGADAFTVGSAVFDGSFAAADSSLTSQLKAVLDACAADPIALLLAGQYPDPDTGELLAAESRAVVIEDSLAGSEAELIAALGAGTRIAVVSDRTTHDVLGARVEQALAARFAVQSIILDARPHADDATVERLLATLAPRTDLVVAVGSGTLNDLTKLVAFRRDCPQAVFATAPSMNGYTSLSASITSDGIKRSFRTRTPLGVYFDLRVLTAAPARLIRAGLGDSACRPTAQADWLLSHLLLDRPYREAPFALLADDERHVFSDTPALLAGNLEMMRHLVRTLVLSGFGMTICNGSYPASQGEHLIAHYVQMMQPPDLPHSFHGEQIAVCTVAMAECQERMLARDTPPVLRPTPLTREDLVRHFGPVIGDACFRELELKCFDAAQTDALNARLASSWGAMRERIRAISVGAKALRGVLADAGAPVEPAAIGWPAPLYHQALQHAREIRNRYTFLDLAADS